MTDNKRKAEPLRLSLHSHIKSLGCDEDTDDIHSSGLISQLKARKALNILHKLINTNKTSRIVLLNGKPGTGKTALATAFLKQIHPVTFTTPSEILTHNLSKTESLTQALRKSISIITKENVEVIEGEVIEIKESDSSITLKTNDMEAIFNLGEKMKEELRKEKVSVGDVILIYKESGKVYKIGKSFVKAHEYDALGPDVKFVKCPDGEIKKIKEEVNEVSFHEMDVLNSNIQGSVDVYLGCNEICDDVRDQVNRKVDDWVLEGKAEVKLGVLFIDDCDLLDIHCFSFLNKAIEQVYCPSILLATNKEKVKINGTNEISLYGMPRDFVDRILVLKTEQYNEEEMKEILRLRADEEYVCITDDGLDMLVKIAKENDLRYAINLLTLSHVKALKNNRSVEGSDVERVSKIFISEKKLLDFY